MVLVELGVVEQRFQAVLEVLGGAPVFDVARRYGVVRQTVHKTVRSEFLTDRVFASVAEAQIELDGWVERYNTLRPHQRIGMVPPICRFEFAVVEPFEIPAVADAEPHVEQVPADGGRRVTRKVGAGGRISLAGHKYHVGRWLADETVDIAIRDGLIEISHRDVLITSVARRHRVEDEPKVWQREPRARSVRPETVGVPVTRKVDSSGNVSFAGTLYRVGNAMRGRQVQVRVVGDTVEISTDGQVIRSHAIRHDRMKEHGAFANPVGRPRRINAAS